MRALGQLHRIYSNSSGGLLWQTWQQLEQGVTSSTATLHQLHWTTLCNSSRHFSDSTGASDSAEISSACDAQQTPGQQTQQESPGGSTVAAAADSDSHQQQGGQGPVRVAGRRRKPLFSLSPDGFAVLSGMATPSGYPETFRPAVAAADASRARADDSETRSSSNNSDSSSSSSSGSSSSIDLAALPLEQVLPPERLRIQLRQEAAQQEVHGQVDAYSLSRALVADIQPAKSLSMDISQAQVQQSEQQQSQQQQQQLTEADKEALEKLIGIMTKDGKKSRARRMLLDAMHIIKQQLAKGQHQQQRDAA